MTETKEQSILEVEKKDNYKKRIRRIADFNKKFFSARTFRPDITGLNNRCVSKSHAGPHQI